MATKKTTTKTAKKSSDKVAGKTASESVSRAPKKAKEVSLTVPVYSAEGKKVESIDLPENIFGLSWNADLIHQVVTSMMSSARKPYAHTKDRGEVSGGGKKPWKQKGTGRARHGSTRSPIWVGGGVAHGPRNDKNFDRKVNRKAKARALFTILSAKLRDGEILFVKDIKLDNPKTREAKSFIGKLGNAEGFEMLPKRRNNAALVAVPVVDESLKRSFNNLGNLELIETRNLNPVSILKYRYLVISSPEAALVTLGAKTNS